MATTLLRLRNYSQIAVREDGSDRFVIVHRELHPQWREGVKPGWLPEVTTHGAFDEVGGTFVAAYREPAALDTLWLEIGARRFVLTADSRSTFSPMFEDGAEPALESSEVLREFRLFEGGELIFEHAYRLHDREKRLRGGMNPFPVWPDEEEDYDLLYWTHRMIGRGGWSQAYRRQGRA